MIRFKQLFLRAIVFNVTIALLLFCVMFLSFTIFVESEIISKWYAFIGGSLLCSLSSLLIVKSPKIDFDITTIIAVFFIGYLLLRTFLSPLEPNNIFLLSVIAFILFYFSFKQLPVNYFRNIDLIILFICLAQACLGLMQCAGIFQTHREFKIVGSFENPAGFSACLSVGFPFCLSVMEQKQWKRYIGIISSVIIAVSIILSGSRAGFLAIIIVITVYFGAKYIYVFKKYRKYTFLVFTILLIIVCGLFFLRKDSVLGRVLIWKNSCGMVIDNPILGNGAGSFMGNYMQYQANYLESNPDSPYAILADNVTHPFNEYLFLTIEYGIVGLLLVILFLLTIGKFSKQITIPHLCLLSIGVFACFSYPLRYPFVLVLMAYCIVNIKSKDIFVIPINIFGKIIGAMLIGVISLFLVNDMRFEKHWGELIRKLQCANMETLCDRYEKLYSLWNGNPMFLYNYGAILNRAGQYEKSNVILNECVKYFNDYDVQMIIAENYFKLGRFNKAKTYYMAAHNMIPNRFMPYYKLLMLYETINDRSHLLEIANIIVNKNEKVPSGTVYRIKRAAQRVIDTTE